MASPATHAPMRVFISYAWEDDEYRQWVAQLASLPKERGQTAAILVEVGLCRSAVQASAPGRAISPWESFSWGRETAGD